MFSLLNSLTSSHIETNLMQTWFFFILDFVIIVRKINIYINTREFFLSDYHSRYLYHLQDLVRQDGEN